MHVYLNFTFKSFACRSRTHVSKCFSTRTRNWSNTSHRPSSAKDRMDELKCCSFCFILPWFVGILSVMVAGTTWDVRENCCRRANFACIVDAVSSWSSPFSSGFS